MFYLALTRIVCLVAIYLAVNYILAPAVGGFLTDAFGPVIDALTRAGA